MEKKWLLYGAYGYTGELIAEEAIARGHRPVLAGRSQKKLAPLAAKLGLDMRVFDLRNEMEVAEHIAEFDLVFHAAGPFIHTSLPMVRACLRTQTHYVDITGEVPVFEQNFGFDAEAQAASIAIVSGAGFDVVPSDCLAKSTIQSGSTSLLPHRVAVRVPVPPSRLWKICRSVCGHATMASWCMSTPKRPHAKCDFRTASATSCKFRGAIWRPPTAPPASAISVLLWRYRRRWLRVPAATCAPAASCSSLARCAGWLKNGWKKALRARMRRRVPRHAAIFGRGSKMMPAVLLKPGLKPRKAIISPRWRECASSKNCWLAASRGRAHQPSLLEMISCWSCPTCCVLINFKRTHESGLNRIAARTVNHSVR